jgi:hypothetical protein
MTNTAIIKTPTASILNYKNMKMISLRISNKEIYILTSVTWLVQPY